MVPHGTWHFAGEINLFERINIACPRPILEEAMRRLEEAVVELK